MERHEILRTRFVVENGQVWQSAIEDQAWQIPVIHFAHAEDSSDHPELLDQFIQQQVLTEVSTPFHLQNESLFRVKLLDLGKNQYVLLMNLHHIIADGWSITLLASELMQLFRQGQQSEKNLGEILAPLDIQFADFADWQRSEFTDERLKEEIGFLKDKLYSV